MGLKLKIHNKTDQNVYFLVWGFPPGDVNTVPWSYLTKSGSKSVLTPFVNPPAERGASHSVLDTLAELKAQDSITFDDIPYIDSGIVFFSFGQKPTYYNTVPSWNQDGTQASAHNGFGVQPPDYMPGTPNADVVFTSSEFTYLSGHNGGIWADTTSVDYFAAPITLDLNGSAGAQTSGALNHGVSRDDIFNAFTGLPDGKTKVFSGLAQTDGSGNNTRVLAPGHGIPAGIIPADYMDDYVNHCWSLYPPSSPMKININGGQYAGNYTATCSGDTMRFFNSSNAPVGVLTKAPSNNGQAIFLCNGVFSAPNNLSGALVARICAGLNRTVLHLTNETQPVCDASKFYNLDQSKSWWATNEYSNLLHQNMSKTYGFPFDDVCDSNIYKPLLYDPSPTEVTFTLDSWS